MPAVELVTVGQRKGVGLPGGGPARYVVAVDVTGAVVTVGSADRLLVDTQRRRVDLGRWLGRGEVMAQTSAHGVPRPATVEAAMTARSPSAGAASAPAAPGQSIALYDVTDTFVWVGHRAGGVTDEPLGALDLAVLMAPFGFRHGVVQQGGPAEERLGAHRGRFIRPPPPPHDGFGALKTTSTAAPSEPPVRSRASVVARARANDRTDRHLNIAVSPRTRWS